MADKQIIIDGVDVNGCLFYQTNFEEDYDVKIKHYCSNWHNSCESNNNSICYYKQLVRAEQENKRLLEIINAKPLETVDIDSAFEIEKLKEQLKRKEQECEELKKQYNCYACGTCKVKEDYKNLETHHIGLRKSFDELHKQLDQLKAENDLYKNAHKTEQDRRRSYENALAEIKEIAKKDKMACESCSERYTDVCTGYKDFENEGDCTHCGIGARAILAKQILQKISECEVENAR